MDLRSETAKSTQNPQNPQILMDFGRFKVRICKNHKIHSKTAKSVDFQLKSADFVWFLSLKLENC